MSALLNTPHPEAFGELPSSAVASRPDDWATANTDGLMRAATDDWQGAREAFRSAVTAIELDGQTAASAGQHSPLALVLSNLAQSLYRTGDVAEAIACQERVVALRIAMTGEGSVAVARSRSDLAAMLGSIGRVEEAAVLARRALMAVESSGAPDMALAAVLSNAARIAIVAEATKDAEPILRRLHAVEARCGFDSSSTDRLLEQIGAAPVTPPAGSPMLIDLDDVFPAPSAIASAPAPIAPSVRYPSPAPLAFSHEIEFVDDTSDAASGESAVEAEAELVVNADVDADELPVGEYPRFPTSEQAAHTHDVRTASTWSAPELPASGAYHLVETADAPTVAGWSAEDSDTVQRADVQEAPVRPESSLERRIADRRRADREVRAPLRRRSLLIGGVVVAVIGVAAIAAMLF